ncbi:MAG: IclR family transcriptional regulator [Rhizobiaceae bacterium]|nr:IclR family transcriptional regulator [Rhizobiaceae bacterium]
MENVAERVPAGSKTRLFLPSEETADRRRKNRGRVDCRFGISLNSGLKSRHFLGYSFTYPARVRCRNSYAMDDALSPRMRAKYIMIGMNKKKIATKEIIEKPAKADRNRLSSVTTAIRVLKAFSEDEAEIGVSALAQKLKIAKSTVHRLATTLVAEGLLEQNPETERYRLGVALFGLGTLVRRRMDLSTEARPYLFDLRKLTGETLLLGIPSDMEIMYVYNLQSPQALSMKSDIGVRRPAHCTAVGRGIFAFAPEETIEKLLAGPLVRRTPKTVTDPKQLRRILSEVRERGYAIEDEESEPGIRAIAAPVHGPDGAVIGSVGIAGPSQRLSKEILESYSQPLMDAAEAISFRLGYGRR